MALRSPLYLDSEALLAQAEYHDIDVPRPAEIIEKSVRNREGGLKAGYGPISASGSTAKNVEFQASYTLEPREKATTSKAIDGLIRSGAVKLPAPGVVPIKDDLVEVSGKVSIAAASFVGKMLYMLRGIIESEDSSVLEIDSLDFESERVQSEFKSLYLRNELPAIPILLKLSGSLDERAVYASIDAGHLVGEAAQDRLEGLHRILGSVREVIPEGEDGYLSTDAWLLAGWEHFMKRIFMTELADKVRTMAQTLDVSLPDDDAYGWIKGPAIVIDAIAIY